MIKEISPYNLINDENSSKVIEAIDKALSDLPDEIKNILIYSRIDELSGEILDSLAWQFHVEGYELAQTDEEKRNLIKNAIELHRYKGTKWAVEYALNLVGIDAKIVEWFENGGSGEPYTFNIKLSFEKDIKELNRLLNLINEYKNVRSKPYVDYEIIRDILFKSLSADIFNTAFDNGLNINANANLSSWNGKIVNIRPNLGLVLEKSAKQNTTSARLADFVIDRSVEINREIPLCPFPKAFLNIFYPESDRSVFSLPIPPIIREARLAAYTANTLLLSFGEDSSDVFHLKETENTPIYFELSTSPYFYREKSVVSVECSAQPQIHLETDVNIAARAIINFNIGGYQWQ